MNELRKNFKSVRLASTTLLQELTKRDKAGNRKDTAFDVLSNRELEVILGMAQGLSTKENASRLCLNVKTVETHRRSIMEKLTIFSVAELTRYAVREGIVAL